MGHWLFLPDDAMDDLSSLAELSTDQISKLRDFLDSGDFQYRYKYFVKVADLLGISDESAAKLCTFIHYVQAQRVQNAQTGESIPEEFETFLRQVSRDEEGRSEANRILGRIRENRPLLAKLFSDLPEYDLSEKVRGLETGPLPHLHNFRAFCDLRPVYDAGAERIVSWFPVIILSLSAHSSNSDEMK